MTTTRPRTMAEKVWEALIPATAQFGEHARIILSSTPYGSSGLYVNQFIPSTVRVPLGPDAPVEVTQRTGYSTDERVSFGFRPPKGMEFELRCAFVPGVRSRRFW